MFDCLVCVNVGTPHGSPEKSPFPDTIHQTIMPWHAPEDIASRILGEREEALKAAPSPDAGEVRIFAMPMRTPQEEECFLASTLDIAKEVTLQLLLKNPGVTVKIAKNEGSVAVSATPFPKPPPPMG